jgi:hypothetical protein
LTFLPMIGSPAGAVAHDGHEAVSRATSPRAEGREKRAASDEFRDVSVQWLVRRRGSDWMIQTLVSRT